jgi:hypothetical protein
VFGSKVVQHEEAMDDSLLRSGCRVGREMRRTGGACSGGGKTVVMEDCDSDAPLIHVIDADGKEISRFTFTIPGSGRFSIRKWWSIARGWDGTIAIAADADFTDEKGRSFLAIVAPHVKKQTVVRLSPYRPEAVTVAGDGTIWVAGGEYTGSYGELDRSQDLLRRCDASGKLLSPFFTGESLETEGQHFHAVDSILISSKDRVGWYAKGARTYLEFSLDGSVVTRAKAWESPAKAPLDWLALCEDGSVFVGEQNLQMHAIRWGVFTLDRGSGTWEFIPRKEQSVLYGCDGTRLASTTDHRSITWLEIGKQ